MTISEYAAGYAPLGMEQITVASTATTLAAALSSSAIPTGTKHAMFWPQTAVRWRADGTAPTASVGMMMAASALTTFENKIDVLNAMKLISTSGSALVNVHFFG